MRCNMPTAQDGFLGFLSFAAFKDCCATRQLSEKPAFYECRDCATGAAIIGGTLTEFPDNIRRIEMGGERNPIGQPDDSGTWSVLPLEKLESLTLAGLRNYWRRPVIAYGKTGPCPNCGRVKSQAASGVCASCYGAARGITGGRLLTVLRETAARLQAADDPAPPPADTADQQGGFDCCAVTAASRFAALGREIGELVEIKQAAYGDSFGRAGAVLRILYPAGISPEQMDDALCLVRILDKMFRIATDKDALGESPYKDIAGYGLLGAMRAGGAR